MQEVTQKCPIIIKQTEKNVQWKKLSDFTFLKFKDLYLTEGEMYKKLVKYVFHTIQNQLSVFCIFSLDQI